MRGFKRHSTRPFNRPNRGPRGQHRVKTFDPSILVKNSPAQAQPVQEAYVPKHVFLEFGLGEQLLRNVAAKKYVTPTPIQDQAIPLLMAGRDVVGIANTGTGKTAAFLLPLIHKVAGDRRQRILIVTPTRELAGQILAELRQFCAGMGIRGTLCIGGVSMYAQIRDLNTNPNFVIGTPGRLKDLELQKKLYFGSFNNVVLDEVDRMLDMGFVKDVTGILEMLAKPRQSAFFSATVSGEIENIMKKFLVNPATISIRSKTVIENITQDIVNTHGKAKVDVLHDLLIKKEFEKVLVFGRTKRGLQKLAIDLTRRGFGVTAIHGNKSQGQRQRSLEQFKSNRVKVLLATDVASRGLDIDNISHVINFDLPESYDDYIHRIGRTGRADKKGIALTLVE